MRMSTSSSMIIAALALSSTTLGAPVDSADASTESNAADSSFQAEGVNMLGSVPVVGGMFPPAAKSVLDNLSLLGNLTSKAPIPDDQKAAIKKLLDGVSDVPPEDAPTPPAKAPVKPREEETFQAEGMDLGSMIGGVPVVGTTVGPALSPVTDVLKSLGIIGLLGNTPLSAVQQAGLAQLGSTFSTVAPSLLANPPTKREDDLYEEAYEEDDGRPLEARGVPDQLLASVLKVVNGARKKSGLDPLTVVQQKVFKDIVQKLVPA